VCVCVCVCARDILGCSPKQDLIHTLVLFCTQNTTNDISKCETLNIAIHNCTCNASMHLNRCNPPEPHTNTHTLTHTHTHTYTSTKYSKKRTAPIPNCTHRARRSSAGGVPNLAAHAFSAQVRG